MKILLIIILLITTNIYTFINAEKIKVKMELFFSRLIFKRIIQNAKKQKKSVDDLTFDDVFEEE